MPTLAVTPRNRVPATGGQCRRDRDVREAFLGLGRARHVARWVGLLQVLRPLVRRQSLWPRALLRSLRPGAGLLRAGGGSSCSGSDVMAALLSQRLLPVTLNP